MKYAVVDSSNLVVAFSNFPKCAENFTIVPLTQTLYRYVPHWYSHANGEITLNGVIAIPEAVAERIAGIKEEARNLITALDWELERAEERVTAGWGDVKEVNDVLCKRENIRRSSDVAEVAVAQLTDLKNIYTFVWSVEVHVTSE